VSLEIEKGYLQLILARTNWRDGVCQLEQ
jgi:hypothetical protein